MLTFHDRHAGLTQPVGERVALVALRVEPGRRHVRRRQPPQVLGEQDGDAWVVPHLDVGAVVVDEPRHVVVGEEEPVGEQVA